MDQSSKTKTQNVQVSVTIRHQGSNGICYAHALATIIRAAQNRKNIAVTPHADLVEELIKKYGTEGASIPTLLKAEAEKYGLKYEYVSVEKAEEALRENRVMLAGIYLKKAQWESLEAFFKNVPKGVLKKEDLEVNQSSGNLEGHALVIVGQTKDYWKIKNSWGNDFADSGFFRMRKDAAKLYFADIELKETDFRTIDKKNPLPKGPLEKPVLAGTRSRSCF